MLWLSFPPYNLSLMIFVAFVPFYYLLFIKRFHYPLLCSYAAGILYYSLVLEWTGKFHYLSVPFISMVSGLLFFAVPLWLSRKIIDRAGLEWGFPVLPSLWVLSEYLKTKGPLSFAFGIIGYSQHNNLTFIQGADIFGVYGISFLIILINYLGFYIFQCLTGGDKTGRAKKIILPVSALSLIIISTVIYGTIKLGSVIVEDDFTINLIQTNHETNVPWMSRMDAYLEEYSADISGSPAAGIDLAVLPENSVKTYLSLDKNFQPEKSTDILNRLSSMSRSNRVYLHFGGLEADMKEGQIARYNSAFLFDREGNISGRYRKRILVPFGEVNPLGKFFPIVDTLLLSETGAIRLSSGSNAKIMKVTNRAGTEFSFGTVICFEGTDAELLREYALKKADFFVNITSDRWTQSNAALRQHALFGVFRAVESRLPYYRCGNGGISSVIDPHGRTVKEIPAFSKGSLTAKLLKLKDHRKTLYASFGNWIIYLCLVLLIIPAVIAIRHKI